MGTDKALLRVGGKPMAVRTAELLRGVCSTVSLIGDPAKYAHLGLPVAPDHFPGEGPLAGIEAALSVSQLAWNLIVGCDMPKLNLSTIEGLFSAGADCAVPRHEDGRIEPLCAVYHRRCHGAILEILASGKRRVTEALQALDSGGFAVRYVRVENEGVFANLNTPEEFRDYTND